MPFPFLPGGVLLAVAVLGGALTVFGLVLWTMDRAIVASRRSMLTGLVAGFQAWTAAQPSSAGRPGAAEAMTPSPAAGSPAGIEIIDLVDRRLPDDGPGA